MFVLLSLVSILFLNCFNTIFLIVNFVIVISYKAITL